jgi:DNA-binding MarR family transcriptional regulator
MTKSSPPDTERALALEDLSRAMRRFMLKTKQVDALLARRLDIHITDLFILELVFSADEPVTPKAVMEQTGLTSGAVTAAIDRIEGAGFVHRVPNPADRRGVIIEPVEGRADKILSSYRDLRQRYRQDLTGFSIEELATVSRFLDAF